MIPTRPRAVEARPLARILMGAALLGLLALTIAAGIGMILQVRAPDLALRMAPWNAQAAGRLSQRLLLDRARSRDRAAMLAERALRRDPTIVAAVASTGILAELRGRPQEAQARFEYSGWLSRRHLLTQLWWIERGVAKNDVGLALRHYDIALRAIRQAPDILFPVLGSAIADAEVRRGVVALYRSDPPWGDRFLAWLVTNGVANQAAAQLLLGVRQAGYDVPPENWGKLEQGLIDQRDYGSAWSLYQQRRPTRSDGAGDTFAATTGTETSPFEWTIVDEQGGSAIGRLDGRNALTFATVPTSGGTLARRFQMLPAGRYRLRDRVRNEGGPVSARPYWLLRCADGRELGRVSLGDETASAGVDRRFIVPGDCRAQWLQLQSDAGDGVEGATGAIFTVDLVREG